MKYIATYTILLLVMLLISSCSGGSASGGGTAKGRSTSQPYELLVVCNKEWLTTDAASVLKTITQSEVPCLPQVEQQFRLTTIEPSNFTKSFMYYANILTVDINPRYERAECGVAHDVYASPQILISLTAPDQTSFDSICTRHHDQILQLFNENELLRQQTLLQRRYSGITDQAARQMFGVSIHAPEQLNSIKKSTDFFWTSCQGQTEQYLNVVMYSVPYSSPADLTLTAFLARRDSVLKDHIVGDGEGKYMTSERRVVAETWLTIGGKPVQEVRGLWAMEGDAMGGPYVAHVHADTTSGRILVVEGFVYAPDKKKRNLIRSLEAALRTLTVAADKPSH